MVLNIRSHGQISKLTITRVGVVAFDFVSVIRHLEDPFGKGTLYSKPEKYLLAETVHLLH